MLKYNGYYGHVEFDDESEVFHGEVINIPHVITFQSKDASKLKSEFKKSVDVYLEFCKKRGIEPAKPYSGKLVVRITPELHQKLAISAKVKKESLNQLITETLEHAVFA